MDTAVRPYIYVGGPATAAKAPGMIVGVYLRGKPCFYGYGTTKLGERNIPTSQTIWEMGSNTKTFTATMLALHQLDGSVNVYDVVDTSRIPCAMLRGRSVCFTLTRGMEALTYFELATFTGGLFDDPPNYQFAHAADYTQANFISAFNHWSAPSSGLPAPDVYSNSSFGLLGQILMSFDGYTDFDNADAYRASFAEWIGRAILHPLGMNCTNPNVAAMPAACGVTTRMAKGYRVSNGRYLEEESPWPWVPWGPAGSLRSNARDMLRYIGAYLGSGNSTGRADPSRLARAMQLARHLTDVPLNQIPTPFAENTAKRQAYAWIVMPNRPGHDLRFWKDGETGNFSSCVAGVPAKNVGVVVIVNIAMHPGNIPCDLTAQISEQTP
ncbi:MAG: serine hydrolase [Gammaproteobacteria bacterium]